MFDFSINVVIGKYEGLNEYVRYKFEDDYFDIKNSESVNGAYGWSIYCPGYCPIVWIPRYPKTPRQYGTLSHELFHAVCHMSRWANLDLTDNSEEVFAHALTHLITKVLESKKD